MPTSPPAVLIVDDESLVVELLREALARQGFRCTAASSDEEARGAIGRQPFDVLVVDIYMPGSSGLELLRYVRRAAPQSRVILISGVASTHCLAEALSLGAYDYFPKPFNLPCLVQAVTAAANEQDPAGRSPLPLRAAKAMQTQDHVSRASLESIAALVQAVEAKDPCTRRHSEQVAYYATGLAGAIGLARHRTDAVRTAALLHDIGKIGVPDSILTKSGPLDARETRQIRRHPILGAEILEKISLLAGEAAIIRHHHERWDGTGYPQGLAAEEIPLGSRIIHVADAMDAMLMERTYKRPLPVERMLAELDRCAGSQFDPQLVRAAIEWSRGHPDRLILPMAA